jgi:hypothetical protein
MSNPEYVRTLQTERKRQRCREIIDRPDVKAKRMARIEEQRALGFPQLTYHNGTGPTVPQKILFDALPVGTVMEFPIPTGKVGRPPNIDLAIPRLRLAIEVDGHSHAIQSRKDIDAEKEQALTQRGWILLRFSNQEILRNLHWVVEKIQQLIATLSEAE